MTPPKKSVGKKAKPKAPVRPQSDDQKPPTEAGSRRDPLYIVGIGGSAGALEALGQFFPNLPPNSGLGFVVVTHLDPTHKGIMPELIQRMTPMKVFQAGDNMKVEADTVYVIPPNKDLAIMNGVLQLMEPSAPRGLRLPIDFFFRHLADDQKERSIGIILSGMGSDGSLGLRSIKEQMGMAMVQDPQTAKYDSMPRSALETGLTDFLAPADALPEQLIRYAGHFLKIGGPRQAIEPKSLSALQKIMILVRGKTGNDFSLYKDNSILRRINRRMSIHQISDLSQYVVYLQKNSQEIGLLFKEMLIGVTNFFRDPEAFEHLKEKAVIPLLLGKEEGSVLRVWDPACSTGEEAYSLAILIRECLDQRPLANVKVQIYGTDIDPEAISFARRGRYLTNIAADVSEFRLQRFFIKEGTHFRVSQEIRDMVVFAPQNLLSDPPFTKLDLLSCRNLLIYFNSAAQKKILPIFYYALLRGGMLFLGPSETISGYNDLFSPVDSRWKIYRRRESLSATMALPEFPVRVISREMTKVQKQEKRPSNVPLSLSEILQAFIVSHLAPPVIVTNENGDLLFSTQRVGRYLEPPVGRASLNVFDMAREGLRLELSVAVRKALTQETEIRVRDIVIKTNGDRVKINLTVKPLPIPQAPSGLLIIVFEEVPYKFPKKRTKSQLEKDAEGDSRVSELQGELRNTKESLQTAIEEMETSQEELKATNEELQSTNEELQSANEELQSSNEELNTSKEEMQSLNEELMTLNAELQMKNDEFLMANNDLRNLLNSTQIPTIFLDNNLNIKRFTQQATMIFKLIPTDTGRPITDIVSRLQYGTLAQDVRTVLDSLVLEEKQVRTNDGRWYTMRIMPSRTQENIVEGVVIIFTDITEIKQMKESVKRAKVG